MACCSNPRDSLLNQLKELVNQIDDGCASPSCCPPGPCCAPTCWPTPTNPFAQVTMTCPPPCLLPTAPQPVKPLQLPCPQPCSNQNGENPDDEPNSRFANFYNNYNVDWHNQGQDNSNSGHNPQRQHGQNVDGKNSHCEDYMKNKKQNAIVDSSKGCPTGFKPCSMHLTPPPGCDPCGIWQAQIQPCPPKAKKPVSTHYEPGPCTRPCCKHWDSKDVPCLYDDPCKAHCFNHPPGMKPSGRYP